MGNASLSALWSIDLRNWNDSNDNKLIYQLTFSVLISFDYGDWWALEDFI
jgi:hypothetical protein